MKMKYSKFVYFSIILFTILALDYWRLIPFSLGEYNVPILLSWGCFGLSVLSLNYGYTFDKYTKRFYLIILFLLFVEIVNQTFFLGYTIDENLKTIVPYMYSFLVVPINYYIEKKSLDKLLSIITKLSLFMLFIKFVGWLLYTQMGVTVFEKLILKYSSWSRNGTLRIEADCLFGITFCYILYKRIQKKRVILDLIIIFEAIYAILVAQSRSIVISMLACTITMLFFYKGNNIKRFVIRCVIFLGLGLSVISEAFLNFINTFSKTNVVYGGSTITRLDCILHYWYLFINRSSWLGFGLLDTSCAHAISLMDNTYYSIGIWYKYYYLADIGILGGFVRFGILAFILYGFIFYYVISTSIRSIKKNSSCVAFITGLSVFFLIECCLANSFESTRAFSVPFYFAIINHLRKNESKM